MELLQTRILEWFAISSFCGPCRAHHYNPSISGGPPWHTHSFTEYTSPFDMTNTRAVKDFPEMFAKMALNSKRSLQIMQPYFGTLQTPVTTGHSQDLGIGERVKE